MPLKNDDLRQFCTVLRNLLFCRYLLDEKLIKWSFSRVLKFLEEEDRTNNFMWMKIIKYMFECWWKRAKDIDWLSLTKKREREKRVKLRKNKRRVGKRYLDTFVRCASRASRQLRLRWPGCELSRMIHLPGFERVGRRRGRQFHSRCTQSDTRQNFTTTTTTTTPMHRHTGSKTHITVTQPCIYVSGRDCSHGPIRNITIFLVILILGGEGQTVKRIIEKLKSVRIFKFTDLRIARYSNLMAFEILNLSISEFQDFWIFKCLNLWIFQSPNIGIFVNN